jgi:anthranilate phosphoribosyltransferase
MRGNLSPQEARECINQLLDPEVSDSLKAEVLIALADKGESVQEILAFSQALLDKALPYDLTRESIDLCGTGGAGHNRFNVSTTSAFILAGAGIPIMKHGNKGSKRPNGSFDLWKNWALGSTSALRSNKRCTTKRAYASSLPGWSIPP